MIPLLMADSTSAAHQLTANWLLDLDILDILEAFFS